MNWSCLMQVRETMLLIEHEVGEDLSIDPVGIGVASSGGSSDQYSNRIRRDFEDTRDTNPRGGRRGGAG